MSVRAPRRVLGVIAGVFGVAVMAVTPVAAFEFEKTCDANCDAGWLVLACLGLLGLWMTYWGWRASWRRDQP